MRRVDLTGKRFGRLFVVGMGGSDKHGRGLQNVVCDCGTEKQVATRDLTSSGTGSCGCLIRDTSAATGSAHGAANGKAGAKKTSASKRVHGHAGHRRGEKVSGAYNSWQQIKQRCFNPKNPDFASYGGRGITMCVRWRDSFAAFLEDMGDRPEGKTIDRINNSGSYEPGNCRWATRKEQRANQERN